MNVSHDMAGCSAELLCSSDFSHTSVNTLADGWCHISYLSFHLAAVADGRSLVCLI